MARLNGLWDTCSMSELGIHSGDRTSNISKWKIGKSLNRYSSIPHKRQRQAIICNTIHHVAALKKAGFKDLAQYMGNDGEPVHVMLWITPKRRIRPKTKRKS